MRCAWTILPRLASQSRPFLFTSEGAKIQEEGQGAGISKSSKTFSLTISSTTPRSRIVLPTRPEQGVFSRHSAQRFPIFTEPFIGKQPMANWTPRPRLGFGSELQAKDPLQFGVHFADAQKKFRISAG
jgi:hypothetical protein